jgi:CBS domain-containing protein
MSKHIKVSQIMTNKVTVACPSNTFMQVMDFFTLFNVTHLPVVDNDVLVGIISLKDVNRFVHDKIEKGESVNKENLADCFDILTLMTAGPVTVTPETTLEDALDLLGKGAFSSLPVVENGKLCGIVTISDLVRVVAYETNKGPIMHL